MTNPDTYSDDRRKELVNIVAALLSTGHYSFVVPEEGDYPARGALRVTTNCADWEKAGFWAFQEMDALSDALEIQAEITKALEVVNRPPTP